MAKKLIFLSIFLVLLSCETEKFTTYDGKVFEVSSLVGMNVFDVSVQYSNDSPETLTGTNNERWIVYFKDINVTLETDKSTDIVQNARKGKKPKESTWAK